MSPGRARVLAKAAASAGGHVMPAGRGETLALQALKREGAARPAECLPGVWVVAISDNSSDKSVPVSTTAGGPSDG